MNDKIFYIVGKRNINNHLAWELMGLFEDKAKAEFACKDYRYFVGPVKLNEYLGEKVIEWPNAYSPNT